MTDQPALIFDFGNVVAFFDYGKTWSRFAARLGKGADVVRQQVLDHGFARILSELERGHIAPPVFAERLTSACGLSLPYDEFVRDWENIFWLNEPVARLIAQLKSQGSRLLLGSNTNILHAEHYRRQFAPTLDLFDHLVLSYEIGFVKPETGFYAACVAAAGVPPGRASSSMTCPKTSTVPAAPASRRSTT